MVASLVTSTIFTTMVKAVGSKTTLVTTMVASVGYQTPRLLQLFIFCLAVCNVQPLYLSTSTSVILRVSVMSVTTTAKAALKLSHICVIL